MNIKNLDPARVLRALYNHARPFNTSAHWHIPGDMPVEQARTLLNSSPPSGGVVYFDYLHGRLLKVDLPVNTRFSGSLIDLRLYNHHYGEGAGERVIREEFGS